MSVAIPSPPKPDDAEALIEEAWELARRRRRRRVGLLAALAVLIAAGLLAGLARSGPGSPGTAVDKPRAAAAGPSSVPLSRYWYARSIVTMRQPEPIVPRIMRAGQTPGPLPLVWFEDRTSVETWSAIDGTMRLREVLLSQRFLSAAGRTRWLRAHQPLPKPGPQPMIDEVWVSSDRVPNQPYDSYPQDVADSLFTYRQLLALPTAPVELQSRLRAAQRALDRRELEAYVQPGKQHAVTVARLLSRRDDPQSLAQSELSAIATLEVMPIPSRLRLALFHAATDIPAVTATTVRDPLGRAGTSITPDGIPRDQIDAIFDPATGQLLDGAPQAPGPIIAQGQVNSPYALPLGLLPVPPRSAPRPPQLQISPTTGGPDTAYIVKLPDPAGATAPLRELALAAQITGPTGPGCRYWDSRPPAFAALLPTARTGRVLTYRLDPAAIHHRFWCVGRYDLSAAIIQSGHPTTLGTATNSAIFFQVK